MKHAQQRLAIAVLAIVFTMLMAAGAKTAETGSTRFGHQDVPDEQLAKEHDLTRKMAEAAVSLADSLRAGTRVDRQRLADMHDFFVNFVDACHHGKEEQYYFPIVLVASPALQSTITTLKLHHDIGKSLLAGVGRALVIWETEPETARREAAGNLEAYAALLERHIKLESELIKTAEKSLSPQQSELIRAGFHYVEADELGQGFHEKYHALAMKILENKS